MFADASEPLGLGKAGKRKKLLKKIGRIALVTTAVGAAGYGVSKLAPSAPTAIANWFKSSGLSTEAANAAANSIIAGNQPMPPDLQNHLSQAGLLDMGGGYAVPIILGVVGLGAIAFFMGGSKKKRRR